MVDHPDQYDVIENDEYFLYTDPLAFTQTIKNFGHSIQKFKIINKYSYAELLPDLDKIFKLIEQHCTDTLSELYFYNFGKGFLKFIEKPFKNVTSLYWDMRSDEQLNLRDLFPSVKFLHLSYSLPLVFPKNSTMHFPTLEHLSIDGRRSLFDELEPIELFKANPQIRRLSVQRVSEILLKGASKELPNLERLELDDFHQRKQIIEHFDFTQLKSIKFSSIIGRDWPQFIYFSDKLEEFEAEKYPYDKYYENVIFNSKNLKTLRIIGYNSGSGVMDKGVLKLASAELNIVDVTLECDWSVKTENIVELIKNWKKLEKIHLLMKYKDAADVVQILRKNFEDKWNINNNNENIFLEKKNVKNLKITRE